MFFSFQASDFTEEDKFLLFDSIDYSSAFEQLDKDGDGEVKKYYSRWFFPVETSPRMFIS